MRSKRNFSPLVFAIVYAVLSSLWIIFSDELVAALTTDQEQLQDLQTVKGVGFVILMSVLIYALLRYQQYRVAEYESRRTENDARIRLALDHAQIIVGQLDTDLRHTWVYNPIKRATSGDQFIGKRIDEILPTETGKQILTIQQKVLETGQTFQREISLPSVRGPVYFSLDFQPLRDEKGQIIGITSAAMDITGLASAREALAESEARYQRLADNAQDIIFRFRFAPDTGFDYINAAITRISGYTPDEFYTNHQIVWQTIHPDDRQLIETVRNTRAVPHTLNLRWYHKDGSIIHTELHNAPVRDENGKIVAVEGIVHDITQRKEMLEALRASEQRLATLMGNLPGMVYRCRFDPQWTMEFISEGGEALTGYPPEALLNNRDLSFADLIHPDDGEKVQQDIEAATKQGETFMLTYRIRTATGVQKWVAEQGKAIVGHDGQIVALEGFISDITDLIQAQALDEISGTLTTSLEIDQVMKRILEHVERIVPHDAANILLLEDDHARAGYWRGYPDEFIPYLETMTVPLTASNMRAMLETGEPQLIGDTAEFSDWIQTPQTLAYRSSASTPLHSHGNIIGFLSIDSREPHFFTEAHLGPLKSFANQTALAIENAQLYERLSQHAQELEQRVAERTSELTQTKERVEAILDHSSDVILLVRPDGTIEQANSMALPLLHCESEELLDQPLSQIVMGNHHAELEQLFKEVITRARPSRMETVVQRQGRQGFEADITLSPITEHDGDVEHVASVVVSIRDITELKRTEHQVRHMLEREMEVSELKSRYVSMASHELRNPLAAMQMSIELVRRYRDRLTPEQQDHEFEKMRDSIRDMTDLLDNMLTLGRVESGRMSFQPEVVDIDSFCRALISEHRQGMVENARIAYTYTGDKAPVQADPRLLRHILNNLLSNALKYSPIESKVRLVVYQSDENIEITVEDQGIGIPAHEQNRLFEAFHRCENVGNKPGNGLGLMIVKQAVEMHGGHISFESVEDQGTTFVVKLPALTPAPVS